MNKIELFKFSDSIVPIVICLLIEKGLSVVNNILVDCANCKVFCIL